MNWHWLLAPLGVWLLATGIREILAILSGDAVHPVEGWLLAGVVAGAGAIWHIFRRTK